MRLYALALYASYLLCTCPRSTVPRYRITGSQVHILLVRVSPTSIESQYVFMILISTNLRPDYIVVQKVLVTMLHPVDKSHSLANSYCHISWRCSSSFCFRTEPSINSTEFAFARATASAVKVDVVTTIAFEHP